MNNFRHVMGRARHMAIASFRRMQSFFLLLELQHLYFSGVAPLPPAARNPEKLNTNRILEGGGGRLSG
jgi:hypothetical protein